MEMFRVANPKDSLWTRHGLQTKMFSSRQASNRRPFAWETRILSTSDPVELR